MMKLSFAVLFLLFTLSLARTPLTQPENDVTHLKLPSEKDVILPELPKPLSENDVSLPELPKNLPESEVSLPELSKTVPGNDVILTEISKTLPESDESLPADRLPSMPYREETRTFHTVPLKLVRLRPINLRFRLGSNLPFRLCHHNLKPILRRQIPFGNDMILSSQRNIDIDKLVYLIGVRRIPSDPFNFHQHNDKKIWKFPDDREKIGEMKKDQSPHHHHHHDEDDNEDNDHNHEHEQRKISKFLEDREKFGEMKLKDQSHHHHHHYNDDKDNDHDLEHEEGKLSKFLEDAEKFWGMNLKDQSPHHHHHHHDDDNEDNDHQQRKILNRGNFGEIKSKNENDFRSHHIDDEADKRSKLYAEYHEMKLRKRFRHNAGEEDEKAKEKKKGGFMRGIRKFLHHYFD